MPAEMLSSSVLEALPAVEHRDPELLGGSYLGARGQDGTTVRRPDGTELPGSTSPVAGVFGWADDACGTRELADALLVDALRRPPTPAEVTAFGRQVLANLPADSFTLPRRTVEAWLTQRNASLAA